MVPQCFLVVNMVRTNTESRVKCMVSVSEVSVKVVFLAGFSVKECFSIRFWVKQKVVRRYSKARNCGVGTHFFAPVGCGGRNEFRPVTGAVEAL